MYFVCAIQSLSRNYIYVGLTSNLKDRIDRHNKGYEKTTKPYRPFILIFFEILNDRPSARKQEKYWKSASGKRKLKAIVSRLKNNPS